MSNADANGGQAGQGGGCAHLPAQINEPPQYVVQVIDPRDDICLGTRDPRTPCAQEEANQVQKEEPQSPM